MKKLEFRKGDRVIARSMNWVNKYSIIENNLWKFNTNDSSVNLSVSLSEGDIIHDCGIVIGKISDDDYYYMIRFTKATKFIPGMFVEKLDRSLFKLIKNYYNNFNLDNKDNPLTNIYNIEDYRPGDKVIILPIAVINLIFKLGNDGNYYLNVVINLSNTEINTKILFTKNMLYYCGKEVTISKIIKDKFKQEDDVIFIEEDGGKNKWSSLMFKRLYEKTAIIRYCNQCIRRCDNTCPFYNIIKPNTEST